MALAQLGQECSMLCPARLGCFLPSPQPEGSPRQGGSVLTTVISTKSRVTSPLEISSLPTQGKVSMGHGCKDLGSEDNFMTHLMGWIFYTEGRENAENEGKEKTWRYKRNDIVKFLRSPSVQED